MTAGARSAGRPGKERDRYRRASRREQLADGLTGLRHNRPLVVLLLALVGGWVILQVTAPRTVRLEDLTVGTCLHVPTSSDDNLAAMGQVGTSEEVEASAASGAAQIAGCDASHSHEVAGVFADTEPAGTSYPGLAPLQQRHEAACEAAFASYVGRSLAGSSLTLTVVVPSQSGWDAGRRAGACLVGNADRTFLSSRAVGSAR